MTESRGPRQLAAELRALGVQPGQDLLVHCSLHEVGPVLDGAATVLEALVAAAGEGATIVVPAHTTANSLSSRDFLAATHGMNQAQLDRYVTAMAGFDPQTTPSSGVGRLAEYVRTRPGATRSDHPQTSFAAIGGRARECTENHALDCHLGDSSPLGWLYQRGAAVLLLGVGYSACSALHLAEYRLPRPELRLRQYRCFVMAGGTRKALLFEDLDLIDDDFEVIGKRLDQEPFVSRGRVGEAECRLLQVRDAVDFTVTWPPFRLLRAVT